MVWLWVALGLFVLLIAGMYVPDWIKWTRWNSERKRLPENKRRRMRPPPVAAPFWSSYAGGHGAGADFGGDGGFGDSGGGGAGDAGGGACD